MDVRHFLTDLVKSIQKNKVNARKDESKGPGTGFDAGDLRRVLQIIRELA